MSNLPFLGYTRANTKKKLDTRVDTEKFLSIVVFRVSRDTQNKTFLLFACILHLYIWAFARGRGGHFWGFDAKWEVFRPLSEVRPEVGMDFAQKLVPPYFRTWRI